MRLILLLILSMVGSSVALAQSEFDPPVEETTAYFLIDSSASMSDNMDDAERAVSDRIKALRENGRVTKVSRTYFGGSNGGLCNSPISIARPENIEDSEPVDVYADGGTQLGTALESVIDSIAATPAGVYIVTDGDETQHCGPYLCDVANRLLPVEDIRVYALPANPFNPLDEISTCLRSAQARAHPPLEPVNLDESDAPQVEGQQLLFKLWDDANRIERWLWIIGAIGLVTSALLLALNLGRRAGVYENEVASLRGDKLRAQDGKLSTEELDRKKEQTDNEAKAPITLGVAGAFGIISLATILTLTFVPTGWDFPVSLVVALSMVAVVLFASFVALIRLKHPITQSGAITTIGASLFFGYLAVSAHFAWLSVDFDKARMIAWLVLSSSFAIIMSVFMSAPIIFASSQNWRLFQLKQEFDREVDAAGYATRRREAAQRASIYRSYTRLHRMLRSAKFQGYWRLPGLDYSDREHLQDVQGQSILIATGDLLGSDNIKLIEVEIERLSKYKSRTGILSLINVLENLESDGRMPTEIAWSNLLQAIGDKDTDSIRTALREIAELHA